MKIIAFLIISLNLSAKVTVIHNIHGKSINQYQLTEFKAIAFEYGKILQIGTTESLLKKFPQAKLIDGNGQYMLPGLHDAAIDLLYAAKLSSRLDLTQTKSLQEVLTKVKNYSKNNPDDLYVVGYGWDNDKWVDSTLPVKEDLDQLEIDKYIWLIHSYKHMGWANSKIIDVAKANKIKKPEKYQGNISYGKDGMHAGIYKDNAFNIIQQHVHNLNIRQVYQESIKNLNTLASFGITSATQANSDTKTIKTLKSAARSKKIPIRLNATLSSADRGIKALLEQGPYHEESEFLHIHSVKYFIDLDFKTYYALLKKPIKGFDTSVPVPKLQHNILQKVKGISKNFWQAHLQAYGDNANKVALEIISNKHANTPLRRHWIEKAQLIDSKDIKKYKETSAIIAITPYKSIYEMPELEKLIGKKLANTANQWQTLENLGVKIISGSNYPSDNPNPFYGIQALVTRKSSSSNKVWNTSQSLSVEQALATYTINDAYANHQEETLGSLERGKWADFILVNQDIFNIDSENIHKTKVLETWVAGRQIYNLAKKIEKEKIFENNLEK